MTCTRERPGYAFGPAAPSLPWPRRDESYYADSHWLTDPKIMHLSWARGSAGSFGLSGDAGAGGGQAAVGVRVTA